MAETSPILAMLLRFACPSCGQHVSATRAQIGITGRCPNCNVAIAVPKTSTLPTPAPWPLVRFACPSCGLHISATHAQIGVTAPCPNCKAAVTVPKTSTLPPPPPAPLKTKFRKKKRYETTVILIDDCAVPTTNKKLKNWTDDLTDARNWLIRQLGAFPGDRYFAAILDHKEMRSVIKEKGRGNLDCLDSVCVTETSA